MQFTHGSTRRYCRFSNQWTGSNTRHGPAVLGCQTVQRVFDAFGRVKQAARAHTHMHAHAHAHAHAHTLARTHAHARTRTRTHHRRGSTACGFFRIAGPVEIQPQVFILS